MMNETQSKLGSTRHPILEQGRAPRLGPLRVLAVLVALSCGLSVGCGKTESAAGTGNTNWNLECTTNDECSDGDECQCGWCTPLCEGRLDCSNEADGPDAICLANDSSDAGPERPAAVGGDGPAAAGAQPDAAASGDAATAQSSTGGAVDPADAAAAAGGDAASDTSANGTAASDTSPNADAAEGGSPDSDATSGASDAPDEGSSSGDAGQSTAVGSATAGADTCLPMGAWTEISGDGVEWAQSLAEGSSALGENPLGLWASDELFVLDGTFGLFAFSPCDNSWRSVAVDWTHDELIAALGTASVSGTRVYRGQFVVIGIGTDDVIAFLDPTDGSWRVASAAEYQAPAPIWELQAPALERIALAAKGQRYELRWGGHVRFDASTTPEDEPLYETRGDGQLFDLETLEWRPIAAQGAPSPRYLPNIAAVGDRFFVFGGYTEAEWSNVVADSELNDGALYDPMTDSWSAISSPPATVLPPPPATFFPTSPQAFVGGHATRAFVLDNASGAGAIYRLGSDDWLAVSAAPIGPTTRWEYAADGSLFNIGVDQSLRLDPTTGAWLVLQHPQPETPAMSSWTVDAWTGRSLLRWRPLVYETSGCENPPPDVGCDPVSMRSSYNTGVMTRLLQ